MLPLEDKQKPSADHIFQLAIALLPVPGLANSTGDGRAAFSMVFGDSLLDKGNVVLGNGAIPISQDWSHEVLHIRTLLRTHVLFSGIQKIPVNGYVAGETVSGIGLSYHGLDGS